MAGLMDTDGPQQQQINGSHHPTGSSGSMAAKTVTNHHNNNNNHHSQHGLPSNPPPFLCSGCTRPIVDQYLLKVHDSNDIFHFLNYYYITSYIFF